MNQPLGQAVGNALEVKESIDVLNNQGPEDLRELCLTLSASMFLLARRVSNVEKGRSLAAQIIASGKARQKFIEIVRLQGGNPAVIDDPTMLPRARHFTEIPAPTSGYVTAMMCEQMGTAGVLLGGGRETKEDPVDPAVGMIVHKKLGDKVTAGEALCTVHYSSAERLESARPLILEAYTIESQPRTMERKLIYQVVGDQG
jgi:thymidine phosphorylase